MMKTLRYLSLITFLGLVGCTPADEPDEPAEVDVEESAEELREEIEEVGEEIDEAYQSARDYSYEQRAELERWADERLAKLNAHMDRLDARLDEASAETKEEYRETMADLREQMDWIEQQLDALQDSSADAWADAKSNILGAMEELENGVQDALDDLDDTV